MRDVSETRLPGSSFCFEVEVEKWQDEIQSLTGSPFYSLKLKPAWNVKLPRGLLRNCDNPGAQYELTGDLSKILVDGYVSKSSFRFGGDQPGADSQAFSHGTRVKLSTSGC